MKIAHVSDCHGSLVAIPTETEVIVISGDFLPNLSRNFYGDRSRIEHEQDFQRRWLKVELEPIKRWVDGRKLIFSSGNHDFINPTIQMRKAGIDAVCVDLQRYEHEGIVFYGFPFVPWMNGEWNFESDHEVMSRHIRRLRDALNEGVDVFVAHCPPRGVLDCRIVCRDNEDEITFVDQHEGNLQLSNLLSYIDEWSLPKLLLCGHLHPHYGVVEAFGFTVSNAATTMNLLEVSK